MKEIWACTIEFALLQLEGTEHFGVYHANVVLKKIEKL